MDQRSLQAIIDRWSVGEVSWCHNDITALLSEINRLRALVRCGEAWMDRELERRSDSANGEPK